MATGIRYHAKAMDAAQAENRRIIDENSRLRAALLAATLAVETRAEVPPEALRAWREVAGDAPDPLADLRAENADLRRQLEDARNMMTAEYGFQRVHPATGEPYSAVVREWSRADAEKTVAWLRPGTARLMRRWVSEWVPS